MGRLLSKTHRQEYAELYGSRPVFRILKASLAGLYDSTGNLRLGMEEIFCNTFAAVDAARRQWADPCFSAAGLLDDIAVGLRDESKEEFDGARSCTAQDISRAVVIIGACATVALTASLKFAPLADRLDAELRRRDARLYEEATDKLSFTLRRRDPSGVFTDTMSKYIASGEYLSDALLNPDAPRQRRVAPDSAASHKCKARRLLKPLSEANNKGKRMLDDTDYSRVLKAVDRLIESGEIREMPEKIHADAGQKELGRIFYKLFSEGVGGFDKAKWAQFLKAVFLNFANSEESTIYKNLSK